MLDASPGDRTEEDDTVGHPDDRDQEIDRPLQFGVLLALGDAERQRDRREHDDRLPAPEGKGCQLAERQPHMAGALHDVVRGSEERTPPERENDRIGVQRTQAAVGQPRQVEVQRRPDELRGDQQADKHADNAPHHCHDRKLPYDSVVIARLQLHKHLFLRLLSGRHRLPGGTLPEPPAGLYRDIP